MTKRTHYAIALSVVLSLITATAEAATCTSRQNGDWSSSNRWNCGTGTSNGPPASGDEAVIGHAINFNTSTTVSAVTVNGGGTLTQTSNNTRTLTVTGNLTNHSTINDNGGSGRFDIAVGGAFVNNGSLTADNLSVSGSATINSGPVNVRSTFTVSGNLTKNGGDFSAGTLLFNAAGTQDATFYGSTNTVGALSVSAGSTVSSTNYSSLTITGNLSNAGSLSLPNSTFTFGGTSAQTTSGNAFTISNLTLNNASGLTLGANATVTTLLTLSSGRITTGSNTLVLSANCPGSITGHNSSRFVIGNLRLTYPAWSVTCVYPVGTGTTGYAPITVEIPWFSGIAGGTLTGTTTAGEHPQIASADIDTNRDVNRYWNLGVAGDTMQTLPAAGSYNLSLGFVAADVDSGATVTSFKVAVYTGAAWRPLAGSASGTTATLPSQTSFGSYAVGESSPPPAVTSINRSSTNPTTANTSVSWQVIFNGPVSNVDASDFSLFQGSGATGASITGVSGTGPTTTWTVTANTGSGAVGTVRLDLVDNDSITGTGGIALGGAGAGNGNFTGQSYTLLPATCTPGLLFCDDFERSVVAGGSYTTNAVGTAPGYGAWTVAPLNSNACDGVNGNRGCAGIDSDIPPFSTASNPRANSTRSLYTRWTTVSVTSPVINLAGKGGAKLSFWLRRGSDCFSEWPSNNTTGCNGMIAPFTPTSGEEFQVLYKNSSGNWIVLAQYPMDDAPGEIIVPVIELPEDALHANFQFRFYQPGGSGECVGGSMCFGGAPNVRGYDYWHVDNVSLREIPAITYTGPFCDTFEGDLSRWTMAGTGGVRIGSTHYETGEHGMDLRWNTVSATTRATDLSTNSGNNLITFWIRRGSGTAATPNTTGTDFPETGKSLRVDYLNSSNAWTTLTTFTGGGTGGQIYSPTTTPATNSFTLPANAKWSGFKLRLTLLTGSGLFDQDYWHVDNVCVGSSVGSTDLSMTMSSAGSFTPGELVTYTMTVTNNGPLSEPGPITIIDTLPAGLTYRLNSAGWSCLDVGQVVSCVQDPPQSLAVGATTSLTLTVEIGSTAPTTIVNTAIVSGQSDDTALSNNTATKTDGFFIPSYEFTTKACANGDVVGSAACPRFNWSSQIAGKTSANVYITAVNSAGVATQLSAGSATTVGFQFGLSCNDSATDHSVQASFTAAGSALPLCTTSGGMPSTWTASNNQIFAAGSPSTGPFTFSYADAGEVELYVRKTTATTQLGSSARFVVSPVGLCLYSTDLSNCAAADATCSRVRHAGEEFNLTLKAVVWESDSDTNLCTGNATTPNFKLSSIALTHTLDAPATGALGELGVTEINITENGWASINQTVSEVGVFTFVATTPVYIPSASAPSGGFTLPPVSTGHFGRFVPHHFTVVGNITNGCGGFTYHGQPFTLSRTRADTTIHADVVEARNAANGVTSNYSGGTWAPATVAFAAEDNNDGTNRNLTLPLKAYSGGAPAALAGSWSNGIYSLGVAPASNVVIARPAGGPSAAWGPFGSFQIGIAITDSHVTTSPIISDADMNPTTTGACAPCTHKQLTDALQLRYGVLRLVNFYGSELLAPRLEYRMEFWDGTRWATNTLDACTAIVAGNIATGGLAVNGITALTNGVGFITFGVAAAGNYDIALNLGAGTADASCNANHPATAGASLPWLQGNWSGNCGTAAWLQDPNARVRLGSPKAPYIYLRERY